MKVIPTSRRPFDLLVVLIVASLLGAACGSSGGAVAEESVGGPSSTEDQVPAGQDPEAASDDGAGDGAEPAGSDTRSGVFPVSIETAAGTVTLSSEPSSIVSLSPTATEMLFGIGAGDRVAAVDLYSNYPPEAPEGTLDGFTPDLEAILASSPDLVVASGLPEDVTAALTASGVAVMIQPAALSFDDTYDQIAQLGEATGLIDQAAALNREIRAGVDEVIAEVGTGDTTVRVFHEIDDSFYTATSASFIGQVYAAMGFENVADPFDDGSGFPLVDGESIIAADPTLIVFTTQAPYGADDIAARPGWDTTTAVARGNIVEVDADIASRWGPRIVDFMKTVAAAVTVGT